MTKAVEQIFGAGVLACSEVSEDLTSAKDERLVRQQLEAVRSYLFLISGRASLKRLVANNRKVLRTTRMVKTQCLSGYRVD